MIETKIDGAAGRAEGQLRSSTLDRDRYISREFLALENDRLWPRIWQVACREEDLSDVGDFYEYTIADETILVVRAPSGDIKAFYNTCLHRGNKLCEGQGRVSELRCSFHAWCWNLDGTNQSILDPHEFPELSAEELSLPECRVGTWGGFVFVCPDDSAPDLITYLEPLPDHLDSYRLEDFRYQSFRTTVLQCNWKTALDAFHEAYHILGTHPQTLPGNDDINTTYDTFGLHSRMIVPVGTPSPRVADDIDEQDVLDCMIDNLLDVQLASEEQAAQIEALRQMQIPEGTTVRQLFIGLTRQAAEAKGLDYSSFDDDQLLNDWDYNIFPNVTFNIFPDQAVGFRARPDGDNPDSCLFDVISLFRPAPGETPPKVTHEFIPDWKTHDWGVALRQDFSNLPKIQAGMHSRGFRQLRLAGYQELRIRHMHEVIDRYVRPAGG